MVIRKSSRSRFLRVAAGSGIPSAAVLLAMCWTAVAAPPAPSLEEAGPAGAVRTVIVSGTGVAGVVLWPAPASPKALATAYLAVEALVGESPGGGEIPPVIAEPLGSRFAAGVFLPQGGEERFRGLLARLSDPGPPSAASLAAARKRLAHRGAELARDPLADAHRGCLGGLFPGHLGQWSIEGRPGLWEQITDQDVAALLRNVRRAGIQVRAAGERGLASRLAAALGSRLAAEAASTGPSTGGHAQERAVVVSRPEGREGQVGFALGFSFDESFARRHGAALTLLAEALREGEGSLEQRFEVGLGEAADSMVEIHRAAFGGGAMVLGARTGVRQAAVVWRLIRGAAPSMASQTLRRDAVMRARQRLDRTAAAVSRNPRAALESWLLRPAPWRWPPPDRWNKPLGAAALRSVAEELLGRDFGLAVMAGPRSILSQDLAPFDEAPVVESAFLCPSSPGLVCAPEESEDQATRLVLAQAKKLMQALSDGRGLRTPAAYRARYRVLETTPVGESVGTLEVEAGGDKARIRWRAGEHELALGTGPEKDEVMIDGDSGDDLPPEALDRLEVFASNEPAVLAEAILGGLLPARAAETPCGGKACPALRVELAQGSIVVLAMDPRTGLPLESRIWWPGGVPGRPADQVISYASWVSVEGIKVAGRVLDEGLGGRRVYELQTWSWR